MKKLFLTVIIVSLIGCTPGCSTLSTWFGNINPAYKQAFGDALRSLEGMAVADIPAAVLSLRKQWLPPGKVYDDLASSVITSYLAAHPNTPDQIKKVLEAIATGLQTQP